MCWSATGLLKPAAEPKESMECKEGELTDICKLMAHPAETHGLDRRLSYEISD